MFNVPERPSTAAARWHCHIKAAWSLCSDGSNHLTLTEPHVQNRLFLMHSIQWRASHCFQLRFSVLTSQITPKAHGCSSQSAVARYLPADSKNRLSFPAEMDTRPYGHLLNLSVCVRVNTFFLSLVFVFTSQRISALYRDLLLCADVSAHVRGSLVFYTSGCSTLRDCM